MIRFALIFAVAGLAAACDSGASAVAPEFGTDPAPVAVDLTVLSPLRSLTPGDSARLDARLLDASGHALPTTHVRWSSSDTTVLRVDANGVVQGRVYGSAVVTAVADGLRGSARLDVVPGDHYADIDVGYFQEIALGAEFGNADRVIRKWHDEVRVGVNGNPSVQDLEALDAVLRDLNAAAPGLRIRRVEDDANLEIHFAPESRFSEIDPNYTSTNYGFFWVWWDDANQIERARVLISTTDITQSSRNHLIREELTQSLGMMNDSWRYAESIYFQGWTETATFAPIDEVVIEMLYRDEIRAGMTETAALDVLRQLPRGALGAVASN